MLARFASRPLGFCAVGAGEPGSDAEAELEAIYLEPAVFGQGYGGALMRATLIRLRADGITRAQLWVFAANRRAIRFYENHGFAADGVSELDHGALAIRMRASLPSSDVFADEFREL